MTTRITLHIRTHIYTHSHIVLPGWKRKNVSHIQRPAIIITFQVFQLMTFESKKMKAARQGPPHTKQCCQRRMNGVRFDQRLEEDGEDEVWARLKRGGGQEQHSLAKSPASMTPSVWSPPMYAMTDPQKVFCWPTSAFLLSGGGAPGQALVQQRENVHWDA